MTMLNATVIATIAGVAAGLLLYFATNYVHTGHPLTYDRQRRNQDGNKRRQTTVNRRHLPDNTRPEGHCTICQYSACPDEAHLLPCGHVFHSSCIREWLKVDVKRQCPLCRSFVTSQSWLP